MWSACTMPLPTTQPEETMKKKIHAFSLTALLVVSLCVSAFAGDIPTIPVIPPDGQPAPAAQPTPTPEQTEGPAEPSALAWLLDLLFGAE